MDTKRLMELELQVKRLIGENAYLEETLAAEVKLKEYYKEMLKRLAA